MADSLKIDLEVDEVFALLQFLREAHKITDLVMAMGPNDCDARTAQISSLMIKLKQSLEEFKQEKANGRRIGGGESGEAREKPEENKTGGAIN